MNKTWHTIFVILSFLGFPLGLLGGSVLLSIGLEDKNIPFLSQGLMGMNDTELIIVLVLICVVIALHFLITWLISLDPARTSRPRAMLCVLGLGPGCLVGAIAWLAMDAFGFKAFNEAMPAAILAAVLSSPLALLPDMIGSAILAAVTSSAARVEFYGLASGASRMRQRMVPNHPSLRLRIGMFDFKRQAYSEALHRLEQEYREEKHPKAVTNAVHECAFQLGIDELTIESGEEIIEGLDEKNEESIGVKVRRRLSDLYMEHKDWDNALRIFNPMVDRTNPADLDEIAKMNLEARHFGVLSEILPDLELAEAPPRQRTEKIYKSAIKNLDDASLKVARMFADYLKRHKRQDEETEILERIVEIDPDDTMSRQNLIDIYRNTILTNRLIQHLEIMANRDDAPLELKVELMELLMDSGKYEEADEYAVGGIETAPDDYRFYFVRASCALQKDQFDEARDFLKIAKEKAVISDSEPGVETIKGLERKIDRATAKRMLTDLETRCQNNPDDVDQQLELVNLLLDSKKAERAAMVLESIISSHPEENDKVVAFLDEIVARDSPPYMLVSYLSDLSIEAKNYDRAHDLYTLMSELAFETEQTLEEGANRILERDPKHVPSLLRRHDILKSQKQYSGAAEALREAMAAGHEFVDQAQRIDAFECFVGDGDLEHGVPIGEKLLEEEPFNVRWYLLLSKLYSRDEQFNQALEKLARAKEVEPGNHQIFSMLEDVRRRQREKRILELRELIDKDPENAEHHAELGDLFIHFDRYEEALRCFQRASQASDNDDFRRLSYTKLGGAMTKRRMFDTALETLREAPLSLIGEDKASLAERKKIFYEVAEELEKNNRIGDALELYKQVFKVDAGFRHVMEKVEKLGA